MDGLLSAIGFNSPFFGEVGEGGSLTVDVPVTVRVLDTSAGGLPVTGFEWWAGLAAVLLLAAGIVLRGAVGRAGRRLLATTGLALVVAAVVVAVSSVPAQAAAGDAVLVTIDKHQSLTGQVSVSIDVSALESKVVDVDNTTPAAFDAAFALDGIAVGSAPVRVGSVADKDFAGELVYVLDVRIAADLAVGDHHAVSRFTAVDARDVLDAVTGTFVTKLYDGTVAINPFGPAALVGVPAGQDVRLTAASFALASADAGAAVPVEVTAEGITGEDAWRYRLGSELRAVAADGLTQAVVDVAPRELPIAGLTAQEKVYDGGVAAALTGVATLGAGVVAGDQVSLTVSGTPVGEFADKAAGVDKPVTVDGAVFTLTGSGAGNYTLGEFPVLTATIKPKPLAVTGLTAQSKTYDGTVQANLSGTPGLDSAAVVGGDSVSIAVAGAPVASFATKDAGEDKVVTVSGLGLSLAGADSGNYTLTALGQLTTDIKPAPVTFTGTVAAERETGDAVAASFTLSATGLGSFSGVVAGESLTLALSGITGVVPEGDPPNFNVEGTFDAVVTGTFGLTAGTGTSVANYELADDPPVRVTVAGFDIVLTATVSVADQTVGLNKYFANGYTVDWGDNSTPEAAGTLNHSYGATGVYQITLASEETGQQRWRFGSAVTTGLVPEARTNASKVVVAKMPRMERFMNAGAPGDNFFASFNEAGALSGLPEGSFNTKGITSVGANYFGAFNLHGALTSLPDGSFNTSDITSVGEEFFRRFNSYGSLTRLPAGSFETGNITSVEDHFFSAFNDNGALTTLPVGSFDTGNVTSVGDYFFSGFNHNGALTTLPVGSFDISGINGEAPDYFFYSFNSEGSLQSLPVGSFDTSDITVAGASFFAWFNESGDLKTLPGGAFTTNAITKAGDSFFESFNAGGDLVVLPEGSFRTHNINAAGVGFFKEFNYEGHYLTALPFGSFQLSPMSSVPAEFFKGFNNSGGLTSLPNSSFNTSAIETVGADFFAAFNRFGQLTSLPEGSFDTSQIKAEGGQFFAYFNYGGALQSLPVGSFQTNGLVQVGDGFFRQFNSSGKLTSLPALSFNTTAIKTAGRYFFFAFNSSGALTSLPEESFDTSSITAVGSSFFASFNSEGDLTHVPVSFKWPQLTLEQVDLAGNFQRAFNSSTLIDREAAHIVNDCPAPSENRYTFNFGQPGTTGLPYSWLGS
ncbi:MAG: YDG domain-containing protein [Bifidobacteriaceae bacterium]|jgi:surface protein|nr:YDG domain-containing protein [Bifidobacteriaceae bacterium]